MPTTYEQISATPCGETASKTSRELHREVLDNRNLINPSLISPSLMANT